MRRLATACAVALLASGCGEDQPFNAPNLGDFVQDVEPDPGEALDIDKLGSVGVVIVLNFLPAESFGFGGLISFRFDGMDVTDEAEVAVGPGSPPPRTANIVFRPGEVDVGSHEVEVEYTDSRNVRYRVSWGFTVRD